jgi:GMP synthase (glutamine-hydrolysing)
MLSQARPESERASLLPCPSYKLTQSSRYGHANLTASKVSGHVDKLFEGLEDNMRVWMSHGDKLAKLPEGFHTIATTANSEYAAIGHESKPVYAIQFHPEVTHTVK